MTKDEIEAALFESSVLTDLIENEIPAQKTGLEFRFTGKVMIEGVNLKIQVLFDHHYPLHKPKYYLLNKDDIGFIPHVERDGSICYTHDENLVLDIDNPVGIITETFALAMNTIQAGLKKENIIDFINEFEAYWRALPDAVTIFSNIIVSENVESIKIGKPTDKTLFAVSDTEDCVNSIMRFMNAKELPTLSNGLYIPLLRNDTLIPPNYNSGLQLKQLKN